MTYAANYWDHSRRDNRARLCRMAFGTSCDNWPAFWESREWITLQTSDRERLDAVI